MTIRTFSLEEAARACRVHDDWVRTSSWVIATTFHECRFRLETLSLDEALRLRTCWHTCSCDRFSSGRVDRDGGGQAIREINPQELPLPMTLMACSAGVLLSKRPDKYHPFEQALSDSGDLVAMDGNHRLAGLDARRRRGEPDLVSEVLVYLCL